MIMDTTMVTVLVLSLLLLLPVEVNGSVAEAQTASSSSTKFERILLTHDDAAVCLDGSPGAYYYRKGGLGEEEGSTSNKFFLFHEGGGWCESLENCLGRSKGPLGSSKHYPKTMTIDYDYFSQDPKLNPLFYNWNFVYMRYCDGASFSGNNETTTVYQGVKLYSRGSGIRQAIFHHLKHKLRTATEVVISGCSAGGLATFLHTDQWCDAIHELNPEIKCVGMPDSGFFLDYQHHHDSKKVAKQQQQSSPRLSSSLSPLASSQSASQGTSQLRKRKLGTIPGNYHAGLKWVFQFSNATSGIHPDCIAASQSGEGDSWKCMFAEHVSPFIHTPMFVLQSEYDSWQTGHVLAPGDDINVLGINITSRLQTNLFHVHPQSGGFIDSCHHHCGGWGQIVIDGDNAPQAFGKWYTGLDNNKKKEKCNDDDDYHNSNKKVWHQNQKYPCKACCKNNNPA